MLTLISVNIADQFNSPFGKTQTIGDLVGIILRSSFVIAGIFVLIMFLIAGFQIMTSAGVANPEAVQKNKNAVTSAVTGFVIVFAAYWIIRLIELMTGSNFVTQPSF